jgi:hypothetical protein
MAINFTVARWEQLRSSALYSSPNIIRMIKSGRMRWTGRVACVWEKTTAYRILVGKPEGYRPLERPRRNWRNRIGWCGLDTSGSGWGPVEGPCKHRNEPSSYITILEFLEKLGD